jgi:hypothetical protein
MWSSGAHVWYVIAVELRNALSVDDVEVKAAIASNLMECLPTARATISFQSPCTR